MTEKAEPLTKEYIIGRMEWFRDGWSDEIPKRVIHSDEPDRRYKARYAWFVGLVGELENAISENVITDKILIEEVEEFTLFCKTELPNHHLTTESDIEKGNKVIERVLASF